MGFYDFSIDRDRELFVVFINQEIAPSLPLIFGRTALYRIGDRFETYSQVSIYSKHFNDMPVGKDRISIDGHCKNVNTLFQACHTLNVPRKCNSRILHVNPIRGF